MMVGLTLAVPLSFIVCFRYFKPRGKIPTEGDVAKATTDATPAPPGVHDLSVALSTCDQYAYFAVMWSLFLHISLGMCYTLHLHFCTGLNMPILIQTHLQCWPVEMAHWTTVHPDRCDPSLQFVAVLDSLSMATFPEGGSSNSVSSPLYLQSDHGLYRSSSGMSC
jgi:hypothetical protein